MIRTYVDAGVLITAARGVAPIAVRALEVIDDPNREFVSSIFVKLEVLPKAIYHKKDAEAEFYETFFSGVTDWANALDGIAQDAFKEACNAGLAAMDALHVASAVSMGAEEIVTTEKAKRRMMLWKRPVDYLRRSAAAVRASWRTGISGEQGLVMKFDHWKKENARRLICPVAGEHAMKAK